MKEWIKDILIAIVIAIVVVQFIKPTIVKESSMEPNFYENDYLFVSKQSYTFGEPKRGDVVVFHSSLVQENGDEKLLIKRIVGLPGETIDISDGKVYTSGEISGLVVPEGEVFCMGDNRRVSIDSRSDDVGCIDIDDIVGKVVFRLYPFSEIGMIKNPFSS